MTGGPNRSAISPEAMAIIDRVVAARAAFDAEGLSEAGTEILIGLGYCEPMALSFVPWEDGSGPGLGSRIAATGCDAATLAELKGFCAEYDWPA